MKNFVIATVSTVALLSAAAQANVQGAEGQPTHMMGAEQQPTPMMGTQGQPTQMMGTEGQPTHMMGTEGQPTQMMGGAEQQSASMMGGKEHHSAPMMGGKEHHSAHMMGGKEPCPPHHKHHKHHARHHAHKHHAHHHGHMHHGGHRPLAVYVNFPPVCPEAFNACPCEYYQGNQAYAYVYHEGYYWYPHPHAGMLAGYTPHQVRGSFWYPSPVHPHKYYVEGFGLTPPEIYPVQVGPEGPMYPDHRRGHGMHHHKKKMKHHAKPMHKKARKPAMMQGGEMREEMVIETVEPAPKAAM